MSQSFSLQFPSSLAVDKDGRVLVTRNELPSIHLASPSSQPMLPTTTEIDIFVQDIHKDN